MTRRTEAVFVACLILAVTLALMAILHTPLPLEPVRVWAETIAEGLR